MQAPPRINPWLGRLLVGTLLLSGLALWWPAGQAPVVAAAVSAGAMGASTVAAPGAGESLGASPAGARRTPLPGELPIVSLDPARFDPFTGLPLTPPSPPPAPPVAAAAFTAPPPPPPPPPAPVVPAMNYRFMGQMVDPAGQRLVYLARADASVLVASGTRLDEGFVVQAIDAQGVHLHYAPAGAQWVIPVPAPPKDSSAP